MCISVNDLWCWVLRNPFRLLEFCVCHRDIDSDSDLNSDLDSE